MSGMSIYLSGAIKNEGEKIKNPWGFSPGVLRLQIILSLEADRKFGSKSTSVINNIPSPVIVVFIFPGPDFIGQGQIGFVSHFPSYFSHRAPELDASWSDAVVTILSCLPFQGGVIQESPCFLFRSLLFFRLPATLFVSSPGPTNSLHLLSLPFGV